MEVDGKSKLVIHVCTFVKDAMVARRENSQKKLYGKQGTNTNNVDIKIKANSRMPIHKQNTVLN